MKSTSALLLIITTVVSTVLGALYGVFQVSHGHAMPVSHPSSLLTMPAIGGILALLAIPVFRYRKQTLEAAKLHSEGTAIKPGQRPKRLDPFYAVRVLVLAKSTAVASTVVGGFQLGLVLLQLTTPVVSVQIWLNIVGVLGAVLAMVVGLVVEKACRITDDGLDGGTGGLAA